MVGNPEWSAFYLWKDARPSRKRGALPEDDGRHCRRAVSGHPEPLAFDPLLD
jgi:hypothetical protein